MKKSIDMLPEHQAILSKILKSYLPPAAVVRLFGSRVSGRSKKYSDVDLAIDLLGQPLPMALTADLKEAFSESDLPYKVDIVDWNAIDDFFREVIRKECVDFKSCSQS